MLELELLGFLRGGVTGRACMDGGTRGNASSSEGANRARSGLGEGFLLADLLWSDRPIGVGDGGYASDGPPYICCNRQHYGSEQEQIGTVREPYV